MASEIRVNKIANRAGLSTVEYTDTGIIVSGIVTCTEISGLNALNIAGVSTFASPLDINGDIDVDGHTNLDNLSVAGVSTFSNKIQVGTGVTIEASQVATGQATFTGIVTASSFSGDGSDLTGIDATKIITGNTQVQTIDTGSDGHIKFSTEGTVRSRIDVNGRFTPEVNNTYDLGTSSLRWRVIYTNDLELSNKGSQNSVDGTWGDWTLQEGENDIFMINNRTGKKFKINMTEVD